MFRIDKLICLFILEYRPETSNFFKLLRIYSHCRFYNKYIISFIKIFIYVTKFNVNYSSLITYSQITVLYAYVHKRSFTLILIYKYIFKEAAMVKLYKYVIRMVVILITFILKHYTDHKLVHFI